MCSGPAHGVPPPLAAPRLGPDRLLEPSHPSQVAYRGAVARVVRHDARQAADRRSTAAAIETYAFRLREVARAYAMLADPAGHPGQRPAVRAGRLADDDPRRDAGQPRDGRRTPRPARHVADEGRARPARQQGRDGGAARDRDPARRPERRRHGARPGSRSRSRTATATTAGRGRRRSRRSARPASLDGQALRGARALPPAGDPRPARPGRRRGRSPSSSWRRSASSSAERRRPPAGPPTLERPRTTR